MKIRPYTDSEWDDLPHVVMTGAEEWDPSVLDFDLESEDNWAGHLEALEADPCHNLFDEFGITESEEGSITAGATNYVRARPIVGRSISLSVNLSF